MRRVLMLLIAALLCATAIAAPKLTACASETPPFVLTAKGRGTGGFSVELFQHVARELGRPSEIHDLPWARCLNEVKHGRIDVAIDAYDDEERRKNYRYSTAYYELTPQVFYRKEANADTTRQLSLAELKSRRGCGVFEYTYEHYDLDAATMDLGATNDKQMLKKLAAGRCDYAVEELEFIIGGRRYEADWPDERDIASFRPGWARGPKLHFLVSTNHPDAAALHQGLNAAIETAMKSGLINRLTGKYFAGARKPAKR